MTDLTQKELDTQAYYRQRAASFNAERSGFWQHELKTFRDNLCDAAKVLEIGCAGGVEAKYLSQHFQYTGVDVTPEFIELAKDKLSDVDFRVMSMYDLSLLPADFEGIWCSATILHAPRSRVREVLTQIRDHIVEGGLVFLSLKQGMGEEVAVLPGEEEYPPRLTTYYTDAEMRSLLIRADFEVIDVVQKFHPRRGNAAELEQWLGFYVVAN